MNTPSWRSQATSPAASCLYCGQRVGERYRLTMTERRLNSGVWYHVASQGRPCDPTSPNGTKAYPDRRVKE